MKTLKAYVMTKDEPFREVVAQIFPDMPFTMFYHLAPRRWGVGDIEIGMSYTGEHYSSVKEAMLLIQGSETLERAARTCILAGFDKRKKEVMDHAIEENNVKLYDYLNSLKEANNG